MSVVQNTSRPISVLGQKSNSVCYHAVCESVAMGESLLGHIPRKESIADLMTKVLYGPKRRYLVSNILFDIYDNHQLLALAKDRTHAGMLDTIDHSIKFEGTRSMCP